MRNVAQFVVVYAYFGPTPSLPHGEVSIRAIVHASEGDTWLEVRERGRSQIRNSLSTRLPIQAVSRFPGAQKPAWCTPASHDVCPGGR